MRSPLITRAVSKFDVLGHVCVQAALLREHKTVLTSILRQFFNNGFGLSLFHVLVTQAVTLRLSRSPIY